MGKTEALKRIEEAAGAGWTHLNLSYYQLEKLPPEISKLKELKDLYLIKNKLTDLPPEIGTFKKLKYLFLGKNKISKLHAGIGNLENLKVLHLDGNRLMDLLPKYGISRTFASSICRIIC
ncbi:MAG: leucine-rich repeat domain-containing protein [Candidatus Thermoplasmatota archaeon]|jgi:Leucine-rich repeat (LRR) protein|nr:leucine-rich repeat domain-containing protein [Candidatus Thermoplasmatota archaeon]MDP7266506.1 leucine-rich repeat domain-containing protein [Candidatus Thermoplasmatota archaeon]